MRISSSVGSDAMDAEWLWAGDHVLPPVSPAARDLADSGWLFPDAAFSTASSFSVRSTSGNAPSVSASPAGRPRGRGGFGGGGAAGAASLACERGVVRFAIARLLSSVHSRLLNSSRPETRQFAVLTVQIARVLQTAYHDEPTSFRMPTSGMRTHSGRLFNS